MPQAHLDRFPLADCLQASRLDPTCSAAKESGRLAPTGSDVRRFRPNILVALSRAIPFDEDEWVGGVLLFGDTNEAAAIYITNRDERCSMVDFDPESARADAEVLKAIVRVRDNRAGVTVPSLDEVASP